MQRTKTKRSLKNPALKTSGPKDGSPRYKPGEHPVYDSAYQQAKNSSPIFNERVRSNSIEHAGILHNLRSTIMELEGETSGDNVGYFQGKFGKWQLAYVPLAKQELAELHQRFKAWSTQQVKEGKARKPTKEWPKELLELRLKKEALLDVRHAEAHYVRGLIERKKAEQEKKRISGILPNGTLGKIASDKDGTITQADGQRVSYTPEGLPFIDEPTSKYNGMLIVDYRKMAEKWVEEEGLTMEQLRKKRDELFKQKKKEAVLNDKEPPTNLSADLVVTASKLPQWIKRLGITKEDWPSWPEGVEPIKN